MTNKVRYALAGVLFLAAIGYAVFYLVAPKRAEIVYLPEASRPARELAAPAQAAPNAVPAKAAESPPIDLPADKPPFLLILGLVAAIAALAWIIRFFIKEKLYQKPVQGDLIAQLQDIASLINAWTLDDDQKVLDRLNREAKKIGEELYRQGGKERMLQAHRLAGSQRVIESAWDGIGPWRG